ncbi:MAG: hypothetical protein AB1498_03610 [bacterium]
MNKYSEIIKHIFDSQDKNGCWKMLPVSSKYYPTYLHYVPNFKSTLWTLILLADLCYRKNDIRVKKALKTIQKHFYDPKTGIYSLKNDQFPIPCLNGNIIYLECYFTDSISKKSLKAIDFFHQYQRFDDGNYVIKKNAYCANTSCYGKHTCYWGIIKLFKGLSFIPKKARNSPINTLLEKCVDFILLHNVCFSSHHKNKIMVKNIDKLTFPNMYKSDYLEILWLLKREGTKSEEIKPAIDLLKSKCMPDGNWKLEKKVNNLVTSVGEINQPNYFITKRAKEVLDFYDLHA